MVRLKVDVIVTANDLAGRAAQKVTKTIPIVVAVMGEPGRLRARRDPRPRFWRNCQGGS
jgi:hypothetical protein